MSEKKKMIPWKVKQYDLRFYRISKDAEKQIEPKQEYPNIEIQATKELQNGRLAMIAVAGFFLQELVNGKGIIENFSA